MCTENFLWNARGDDLSLHNSVILLMNQQPLITRAWNYPINFSNCFSHLFSYFPCCNGARASEDGVSDYILEASQDGVSCRYSVFRKGKLADLFRDFKNLVVNLIGISETWLAWLFFEKAKSGTTGLFMDQMSPYSGLKVSYNQVPGISLLVKLRTCPKTKNQFAKTLLIHQKSNI